MECHRDVWERKDEAVLETEKNEEQYDILSVFAGICIKQL